VSLSHNMESKLYTSDADSSRFEVDFATSFEILQTLRARMLAFCKDNARDFLPIFDVVVDDIPGQGKMVLKADIKWVNLTPIDF
jgi:hypothetical protein